MKESPLKIVGVDSKTQSFTKPFEFIKAPSMYEFVGSSKHNELIVKLCDLIRYRFERESGGPMSQQEWETMTKSDEFLRLLHFMADAYKLGTDEATI